MRAAFAVVALLLAEAAVADCPVGLGGGVAVETWRGIEHFAPGPDGTVQVTSAEAHGDFVEVADFAGAVLPVLVRMNARPGAAAESYVSAIDFDRTALLALRPYAPGDVLTVEAQMDGGPMITDLRIALSVGQGLKVEIGGCRYGVLPVSYQLHRPDGIFTVVMNYIPALDIAYSVRHIAMDGQVTGGPATDIWSEAP